MATLLFVVGPFQKVGYNRHHVCVCARGTICCCVMAETQGRRLSPSVGRSVGRCCCWGPTMNRRNPTAAAVGCETHFCQLIDEGVNVILACVWVCVCVSLLKLLSSLSVLLSPSHLEGSRYFQSSRLDQGVDWRYTIANYSKKEREREREIKPLSL